MLSLGSAMLVGVAVGCSVSVVSGMLTVGMFSFRGWFCSLGFVVRRGLISADLPFVFDSFCVDLSSLDVSDNVDVWFVRCLSLALVFTFDQNRITCRFQFVSLGLVSFVMVLFTLALVFGVIFSHFSVVLMRFCWKVAQLRPYLSIHEQLVWWYFRCWVWSASVCLQHIVDGFVWVGAVVSCDSYNLVD